MKKALKTWFMVYGFQFSVADACFSTIFTARQSRRGTAPKTEDRKPKTLPGLTFDRLLPTFDGR
ncbi:hypothetical protein [Larkinella humicola]|uniref:Uncharacterized protein n=1 Tax=Larkinella humicola TaxID=2607654 RepID=A0A5N1JH86_9BACT|nr:hypothetical protein [Larkinella humicola]KAA9353857.1 hypothetical protein F0P93_14645 [Larkinella humicola]